MLIFSGPERGPPTPPTTTTTLPPPPSPPSPMALLGRSLSWVLKGTHAVVLPLLSHPSSSPAHPSPPLLHSSLTRLPQQHPQQHPQPSYIYVCLFVCTHKHAYNICISTYIYIYIRTTYVQHMYIYVYLELLYFVFLGFSNSRITSLCIS